MSAPPKLATLPEIDDVLGDPRDPDNPLGYVRLLDADERARPYSDGERVLDAFGLNAEFVPAAHGGRLDRADRLAETMRALWRRDPALGLGYGLSSLLAGVNVWTSGDEAQRDRVARLLLGGGRVAAAFHELDHGNDFAAAECSARPNGEGWLVSGRKEVVANLARAEAMVLYARTSDAGGSRSHSQFLLERGRLDAHRIVDLPRIHSSGMREVELGALRFDSCPIPAEALLGREGQGVEISLRSHLVTRSIFPSMILGPLDTALRLTLECALERRLYRGTVADIPYVRAILARAFADLLAADAFAVVAARGLHLIPKLMPVYAPAAKYLVSGMVLDAFAALRSVLGAQAYLRQGPYAMFQKLARDIAPATFAHISRSACLVTILPHLPRFARAAQASGHGIPDGLFDIGGPLPPLRLDALETAPSGFDLLASGLADVAEGGAEPEQRFAVRFAARLRDLRAQCADLGARDLTIDASAAAFAIADQYTVLLAAACLLGIRRHGGERAIPHGLLLGALDRLDTRLGGEPVLTAAERQAAEDDLFAAAVDRLHTRTSLDLSARRIPG